MSSATAERRVRHVLVTGGSGFIGRHVVAELSARGHQVMTLHRGEPIGPVTPGTSGAIGHVRADVLSEVTRRAIQGMNAVVHLAGRGDVQESLRQPLEYNLLNAVGTLQVLEAARESGAHVVLASTQRIYAPSRQPLSETAPLAPTDPYAVSKLVAERWCQMYAEQLGVPTTIVRLFSVYGPGQVSQGTSGVVTIFVDRARRGLPLEVHARQRRDLTYVGDVARGIRLALERPPGRDGTGARVYNLASGVGTTLEELARLVCEVVGSRSIVIPPTVDSVEGDRVADVSRARAELGFEAATTIQDGLRLMCEHAVSGGRS